MTANLIKEVRRRLAAATPGPWARIGIEVRHNPPPLRGFVGLVCETNGLECDAEFIAHSPDDLKKLCDIVEYLVDAIFKVSLGHERGCGVNEGCRCTCVAQFAVNALSKADALAKGDGCE